MSKVTGSAYHPKAARNTHSEAASNSQLLVAHNADRRNERLSASNWYTCATARSRPRWVRLRKRAGRRSTMRSTAAPVPVLPREIARTVATAPAMTAAPAAAAAM